MAIADILGQLLGAGGKGLQGLFGDAAGFAMHGPAAYQEQQENARQAAQLSAQSANQQAALAQALNLHNTMTPYESGQLALGQSAQQQADKKDTEAQNLDLVKLLGAGAQQVPDGTPGSTKFNGANLTFPKSATHTIGKDSPLGKAIGLDSDLTEVPQQEYLNAVTSYADKISSNSSKQAALDAIEAQVPQITEEINNRFSPAYYKSMYGDLDPVTQKQLMESGEYARKSFQSQLAAAAASDRKQGNTSQMTALTNQLRNQQTEAEKFINEQRMSRLRTNETKAGAFAQFGPPPTDAAVKQWTDALQNQGTDILSAAKTAHPLLPSLVEAEAARRGMNLVKMSTDERDTRDRAGIALPTLQRALNIINQPGMDQKFGPMSSRWQSVLNGDYGSGVDLRWKQVADNLIAAKGLLGKMHFSARGAANQNVQKILSSLYDENKMDVPTLRRGIMDVMDLMKGYANAGYNSLGPPSGGASPQQQLGLAPAGPALPTFGGK